MTPGRRRRGRKANTQPRRLTASHHCLLVSKSLPTPNTCSARNKHPGHWYSQPATSRSQCPLSRASLILKIIRAFCERFQVCSSSWPQFTAPRLRGTLSLSCHRTLRRSTRRPYLFMPIWVAVCSAAAAPRTPDRSHGSSKIRARGCLRILPVAMQEIRLRSNGAAPRCERSRANRSRGAF